MKSQVLRELERTSPPWPPDLSMLIQKDSGLLQHPAKRHLAYCPRCLLDMHPSYYAKHSDKECREFQNETVGFVHEE